MATHPTTKDRRVIPGFVIDVRGEGYQKMVYVTIRVPLAASEESISRSFDLAETEVLRIIESEQDDGA